MSGEIFETTCTLGEVEFLQYHISNPAEVNQDGELEHTGEETITGTISFSKDVSLPHKPCKIRINALRGSRVDSSEFIEVDFPNTDELDLLRAHRKYLFTAKDMVHSGGGYYKLEETDSEQVTIVLPTEED